MIKRNMLRSVIFIAICLMVFIYLNKAFSLADSDENSLIMNSFYAEKENTLEGIYLGSSATTRFWNGGRAYDQYGISVFGLATASQPMSIYPYLMKESQKTQSPKLFILELRDVTESADDIMEEGIRRVTDNMPLTLNRIQAINAALDFAEKGDNEVDKNKMNYYLPLLKYHGRWQSEDLSTNDLLLRNELQATKGFLVGKNTVGQEPQQGPLYTNKTEPLPKETEAVLREILSFCDDLDAEVLFVLSPYSERDPVQIGQINEAVKLVKESGYPILNFNTQKLVEAVGLDWETDFYDNKHANKIGSEKYTDYLGAYITRHYGLKDHRGEQNYESWEKAYDTYLAYVEKYGSQLK